MHAVCLLFSRHVSAQEPFAGVRLYYVESTTLEVRSVLLALRRFEPPHTAEATEELVRKLLGEWGLDDVVDRAVTDNASTMVAAFERLQWRRLPCVAHWLQLTINDCLFNESTASPALLVFLRKCRAIVAHFSRSTHATDALLKIQKALNWAKQLKMVKDVETRWNSTYLMLARLIEVRDALEQFVKQNESLEGEEWDGPRDYRWWKLLEELVAVLRPFYTATVKLQGDAAQHVSISMIYPQLLQLQDALESQQPLSLGGERVRAIANLQPGTTHLRTALLKSLKERWGEGSLGGEASPLYQGATALDPRFKPHALVHETKACTEALKEKAWEEVRKCLPRLAGALDVTLESATASAANGGESTMSEDEDVYVEDDEDAKYYRRAPASQASSAGAAAETADTGESVLGKLVKAEFDQFWAKVYEDEIFRLSMSSDPIKWWAAQREAGSFRNLAVCAISVLAIPATSACVERLFSAAGQHVTDLRRSLGVERLQQMVLISENWDASLSVLSEDEVRAAAEKSRENEKSRQLGLRRTAAEKRTLVQSEAEGHGKRLRCDEHGPEIQVVRVISTAESEASMKTQQSDVRRYFG